VGSTLNLLEIFRSSGSHQPVQTFGQMCSHLGWPFHHDDIASFDIFTVEIVKLEVVLKLPDPFVFHNHVVEYKAATDHMFESTEAS
jgi:hypothetical protein